MSLSKIQSLRAAAVSEDCVHQLDISGHSSSVQMSRERGNTSVCSQEKARSMKLKTDCQFFSQEISKSCSESEDKQSFCSITQAMEEEEKQEEKIQKREEEALSKQRKQALSKQQQEIEDKKDQIYKMTSILNESEIQRTKSENTKKKKPETLEMSHKLLTETWQRTQSMDQQELLQKQSEEEKKCHEEAEKFLQNQHKELQRMYDKWKQQTKQMQQETQSKLDNLGCKSTSNMDRSMEMRRKYKEMEQVVSEDKREQKKLRQQEAAARAATKVQAWWRGCMVRRRLGAFKKAEESKKVKKKKGKKK